MPTMPPRRVAWSPNHDRPAVEPHLASANLGHTEASEEKVELSHSLKTCHAKDLSSMQSEARVFQFLTRGKVAHAEDLRRLSWPRRRPWRECLGDRAADDHLDHLLLAEIADRDLARDVAAVA
jgi:hypothetical protein